MKVFGVEKFRSLLLAGSITVLANYVVRLSDSAIAGNMLGPFALAGVNLAGPFLSAVSFLGSMIAIGVGTEYSIAMGQCDRRRAHEFFTQGLWSVMLFGATIAFGMLFGCKWYLAFFGATAEVSGFAGEYLVWIWPIAVLEGLETLLVTMGYADGDSRLCLLSYAVVFVGNFLISVVAVKMGMGVAGCALGSVIADSLGVLVMLAHFLRKSNTLCLVRHFRLLDTWRICIASFGDAAAFLCDGLLFLFLNKFIITHFGSGLLPTLGVVMVVWGLLEIFNGIGVAIQPIVTVYYGEGNYRSIRTVMNSAMRWALGEGLAMAVLMFVFAEPLARMLGVSDAALLKTSVTAVRLLVCGFVVLAFAGLFNSYYMFIEKSMLAGMLTFLSYLVMPIASTAIGSLWDEGGLWFGLSLGPVLGLAITAAIIVSVAGRRAFPLLLDRAKEERIHVFNLELTERQIVDVSRKIGRLPDVPMRAALLTEEVFMVVRERNRGRRILGEVTIDVSDGVKLTLRDDGDVFDITDADAQISSLRSFLVASVMCRHKGKMNLVTTGFNRNVFRF